MNDRDDAPESWGNGPCASAWRGQTLQERLKALANEWRGDAHRILSPAEIARDECADELLALLAAPPTEEPSDAE